jgi:hypothetical protein
MSLVRVLRAVFGPSAHASVLRNAIFFTPLFLATALALVAAVLGAWNPGPVLFVILAVLALLFGYQSIQSLRDLRAPLRTTRGPVVRIWSKMDLIVTRSYYIAVGKQIFRVPFPVYYDLREEAKRLRDADLDGEYRIEVEVVHYPHTGTVESVRRLGPVRIDEQGRELRAEP